MAGDLGDYNDNPLDFMSPHEMAAFALGSDAVINGGSTPRYGGADPALNPGLSSPMRGMVPDAAVSRPAISTGARPMLDMGAPAAPNISAPAPVAPIQPVLRTAAQPNIPMPGAPAIDPRRAQLEQQAAGLRQPIDSNAKQFQPPWWKYLAAIALGTAAGLGRNGAQAQGEAVDKVLNGKYIDANTKRLQQLGAAEQDISAIDKTQQEKDKQFSQEMDIYKGAIGQRREDRAEESQSRRDAADEQRNANEDRRLTTVEKSQAEREKQDSAREAETIRHNQADEALRKQSNDTADRNATTRESNEKDRAARYAGVKGADKGKIDKVYSDRDKAIAKLDSEKSRSNSGLAFLPDGPTKQKQTQAIESDYQSRVQKIHDSTKQRVEQLGGKYDQSTGGSATAGKYSKGDQIKGGKYDGYFVLGTDAKGNYQLSKAKP